MIDLETLISIDGKEKEFEEKFNNLDFSKLKVADLFEEEDELNSYVAMIEIDNAMQIRCSGDDFGGNAIHRPAYPKNDRNELQFYVFDTFASHEIQKKLEDAGFKNNLNFIKKLEISDVKNKVTLAEEFNI